jgi:sugar phosphate isomerase/epimerase
LPTTPVAADRLPPASRFSFNCFNSSTHLGLPPTLPEQIAAAATAGYDFIGPDIPSLLAHEAAGLAPQQLREQMQRHGVDCFELVPLSLSSNREAFRQSLATTVRLAPLVGAKHVLATVRGPVDSAVVDFVRLAAATLADIGVAMSIEFMPVTELASLELAVELLDRVADNRVGIVLDVWHFMLSGSRWQTLDELPVERIGFVQIDDAPSDSVGTSSEDCMDERVLPGEGAFPLTRFRDALIGKGYRGVVSIEVLSRAWRSRPIAEFARATLQRSRALWFGDQRFSRVIDDRRTTPPRQLEG